MKFQCQESCKGKCCSASWHKGWGFVFLTKEDTTRLSRHLHQPITTFAEFGQFEFTRFSPTKINAWYLKMNAGTCQYFQDGKCGVYEARPTQCRTFPFWPEYITKMEKLKEICPGIGVGEEHGPDAFFEQLNADKSLCNPSK